MKAKDVIIKQILEKMEEGHIPWQNPYLNGGVHRNFVTGKPYNGINVLTTWLSGYTTPYWLSFKQAKELGGHVKKGEKGSPILFFTVVEDKNNPDKTFPIFRYTSMFNVEQCDLPFEIKTENTKIGDPIHDCEVVISQYPVDKDISGKYLYGSYDHEKDLIKMPEAKRFTSIEEYYSTFFHEIIHSTGSKSRLKRNLEDRALEELIAEIGSAMLCSQNGMEFCPNMDYFENQVAYIQGWARQIADKPHAIITAASEASKAVDYIMTSTMEEAA